MVRLMSRFEFTVPLRLQIERRKAFSRVFNFICFNKVEGVFIEFGVASGMTLKFALASAKARNLDQMMFYGVDTFLGFPETSGPEVSFKTYSSIVGSRSYSRKTVKKVLRGQNGLNLKLIAANMETDNPKEIKEVLGIEKIAVAHLDMDYYSPTLNALNVIADRLAIGTILMFDNFFFFAANDAMGERKALIEFKELHPDIVISDFFTYGWHGKAFVVSAIHA